MEHTVLIPQRTDCAFNPFTEWFSESDQMVEIALYFQW